MTMSTEAELTEAAWNELDMEDAKQVAAIYAAVAWEDLAPRRIRYHDTILWVHLNWSDGHLMPHVLIDLAH